MGHVQVFSTPVISGACTQHSLGLQHHPMHQCIVQQAARSHFSAIWVKRGCSAISPFGHGEGRVKISAVPHTTCAALVSAVAGYHWRYSCSIQWHGNKKESITEPGCNCTWERWRRAGKVQGLTSKPHISALTLAPKEPWKQGKCGNGITVDSLLG